MHILKRILAYAIILIILAGICALAFVLASKYGFNAAPVTPGESYTDRLQQSNAAFAAGLQDQDQGDFSSAITQYKQAISQQTNPYLTLQAEMYLGVSYANDGDYTDAINLFKSMDTTLNANPGLNWSLMHAYVIQTLANTHHYDITDDAITSQIFSTPPYSSFGPSATTTVSEAYRNLYAYAASFYPLGVSETRVAEWYAYDLFTTLQSATTSPEGVQYLSIINTSLANADTDIQRIQSDPVAAQDSPEIWAREGEIDAYLTAMGIDRTQDMEQVFQQAANYDAVFHPAAGPVEIYHGIALAILYDGSASSSAEISSVLSVFTPSNNSNLNQYVVSELTAARLPDPEFTPLRDALIKLAGIDSSFKTYLISIGWQESDFFQ